MQVYQEENEVLDPKVKNNIPVNLTYPRSNEFDFYSMIEVINFDKECKEDLDSGNGFLIQSPKATNKKDIKNPDGIYSPRFGQKMGDANPFADRYSCECGSLKSRVNHGIECPVCHTKCKYVDDDFKMFGWIQLKEKYHLLHPKFYDTLDYIFGGSPYNIEGKKIKGTKLQNMLNYSPDTDQDCHRTESSFKPDNEPFYGIGMMAFYERFDEILEYYKGKNQKKDEYFDEIEDYRYECSCGRTHFKSNLGTLCPYCGTEVKYIDKDMIFTHSIPVFTTHLRPTDIRDGYMYFEPTNAIYNMINRHVHDVNKDKRKLNQDEKTQNDDLFKAQMKVMELSSEVMEILSGKKGQLRMLIGG